MKDNTIKSYVRYLIDSNKRLIMFVWILSILLIPLLSIIGNERCYGMAKSFIGLGSVLAVLSPIYFFRYVLWKRSSETYFALPITRRNMFKTTFIFSILVYLIPLFISYYIGYMIMLGNGDLIFNDYPYSSGLMITYVRLFCAILPLMSTIMLFFISALITWICSFANNIVDALCISGLYIVLSILLISGIGSFLGTQISHFVVGSANMVYEIPFLEIIYMMIGFVVYHIELRSITSPIGIDKLYMFWLLLYWFILGVIATIGASKLYIKRKQENIEQRTTQWYGYPLMIFLIMVNALLSYDIIGRSLGETAIFLVILFIIYIGLLFFANRCFKVRARNVVGFIVVVVTCIGFSQVFITTKAFHLVEEVIDLDNVTKLEIRLGRQKINEREDNVGSFDLTIVKDSQGNEIYKAYEGVMITITNKDVLKKVTDLQQKTMDMHLKELYIAEALNNNQPLDIIDVSFYVEDSNKNTKYRNYVVSQDKGNEAYQTVIDELEELYLNGTSGIEIQGNNEVSTASQNTNNNS